LEREGEEERINAEVAETRRTLRRGREEGPPEGGRYKSKEGAL
jgi:hypothetical protein